MNNCYLIDCMDFMKDKPDDCYDLAIVDPPYFSGPDRGEKYYKGKNNLAECTKYKKIKNWNIPDKKYFDELLRISNNQIIWGCNHFNYSFPSGRIVWLKMEKEGPFSTCEIGSNSIWKKTTHFKYLWNGFWQENMKNREKRIHPTQKPIALYKWLLKNYAKPGYKLLDTHSGSGSFRIAAYDMGFDLDSCELDKDCFDANEKRFQDHIQQNELFSKNEYQDIIYKD